METLKPLRVPASAAGQAEHQPPQQSRVRLGTMLVRADVLTAEQLEEALAEKAETGKRLGEIVVDRGWVTSRDLGRALAEQHHIEFIDLMEAEIEDAAASLLPERLARRYRAVPIRFLGEDKVLVAVADPTDVLASDDLRLALGMHIEFAVADQHDLERTLGKLYRVEFDIGGDEVLARLRADERTKDIPVVILSADATDRTPGPLLEAGAQAYLTKPIGVRKLLEVVDTYVAG
jgi:type IV pilus assembly protein PilB